MDTTDRLRLATRIHFALLRHYGADVSIGTLLRGGEPAQEALWVCEASAHPHLAALARELSGSWQAQAIARATELQRADDLAAPQDAAWARDTSGFGVTRPGDAELDAAPAPMPAQGWFNAARRRLRGGNRSPR